MNFINPEGFLIEGVESQCKPDEEAEKDKEDFSLFCLNLKGKTHFSLISSLSFFKEDHISQGKPPKRDASQTNDSKAFME